MAFTALGAGAVLGLRFAGFRFRWEGETASAVRGTSGTRARAGPGGRRDAPGGEADASRAPIPAREASIPAVIDFESVGPDRVLCAPCPVGDEWQGSGLRVSFRSWSASSTRPYLLDAREYLPADGSRHALGPALLADRGLEVGVLSLRFAGRPRRVSFTLYGPDIIARFDVRAWSGGLSLEDGSVRRVSRRSYRSPGGGGFREERIAIESPSGIDRVELDGWGPPGHMLLVDDLVIDP